ncbi:MAG: hypothetical protein ACK48M_00330, partial [Planctomycetia bacterium]
MLRKRIALCLVLALACLATRARAAEPSLFTPARSLAALEATAFSPAAPPSIALQAFQDTAVGETLPAPAGAADDALEGTPEDMLEELLESLP